VRYKIYAESSEKRIEKHIEADSPVDALWEAYTLMTEKGLCRYGLEKKIKNKKCRTCKREYKPMSTTQTACGWMCALAQVPEKREKLRRKENLAAKKKLKTRSTHLKEAQTVFNKYIRVRDEKEPCISCGRHHQGQYHAGHYRSVGAAPELRFVELNVHKQCSVCNNFKSGNALEYRINLIKKIGVDQVEWLEGKHDPKKYTIDQIQDIKAEYRQKLKQLQLPLDERARGAGL